MVSEIERIKKTLQKELPGKIIQYKMAPSDRPTQDQALNLDNIRKSAVLVLLFYKNKKLHVLLTQRAIYKGVHSGQISFPGGKFEAEKDKNLLETVIRESNEEIQLTTNNYKILGKLTTLNIPISKTSVLPFVAFCSNISFIHFDGYEIVDLYQIPISHLQDSRNKKIKSNTKIKYPYYDFNGKEIWGATAMIISELLEVIERSNVL
jgi:8-oxo-dGTP pyrophosphatase MutT (NUDIX family)